MPATSPRQQSVPATNQQKRPPFVPWLIPSHSTAVAAGQTPSACILWLPGCRPQRQNSQQFLVVSLFGLTCLRAINRNVGEGVLAWVDSANRAVPRAHSAGHRAPRRASAKRKPLGNNPVRRPFFNQRGANSTLRSRCLSAGRGESPTFSHQTLGLLRRKI